MSLLFDMGEDQVLLHGIHSPSALALYLSNVLFISDDGKAEGENTVR